MATLGEPSLPAGGTNSPGPRLDLRFTDRLELARAALDLVRTRFGAVVASLGIADHRADQLLVLTDASVGEDHLPSFVSFPLTTRMLLTDSLGSSDVRTLSADEYSDTYPTVASVVRRPDLESLVAVGFQRGGVTGSISLGLPRSPDPRAAGDLQAVAALVGDAFARWEEANRRNRQAADLQRSLAPGDRSSQPDLARRAVHLAATPDESIGGDWFDVFDLPDGRTVAIVGDVVGRGADAVVAMAQVAAALRALLVCATAPDRAVEQLDRLSAVTREAAGATCVVAVFDLGADTVELCHAGHPRGILLGPSDPSGRAGSRPATFIAGAGPLIGFPDGPRSSTVVPFPPGSTLVLCSDGMVRAATSPDDRVPERLAAALGDIPDGPPGMLVAELLERWMSPEPSAAGSAAALTDVRVADDVVVLALRRPTADQRCFSVTEDASPAAITRIRHALAGWLADRGCAPIAADVELAVSELLANVVEHAYRSQHQGRMIVESRVDDRVLEVAVIDDGHWSTQIVDTVRGRGLGIVHQVAQTCTIRSARSGTIARMTFDLQA